MQGPRGEGDGEGGGDNTQYLGTETSNSVYCAQKVINRVLQIIGAPLHSKTGQQLNTDPYILWKHI